MLLPDFCNYILSYLIKEFSLDARRLRFAAEFNNVEVVREMLINHGVNPNIADFRGRAALHIAAAKGYTSIVR